MTRPSFQFYPADWLANSNLRRCTFEERGIWLEVMCLLHDQDEYGLIRWTLAEIAQAIGCPLSKLKTIAAKGVLKGSDGALAEGLIYTPRSGRKNGPPVTLIAPQSGPVWFSSRMVEDEYKRINRAEFGAPKTPPKVAPKVAPKGGIGAAPNPTPFSCAGASRAGPSSSSSSSIKDLGGGATTTSSEELPADHPVNAPPLDLGDIDRPTAAPLPMREEPPVSEDPAVQISVRLRRLGVSALFTHPDVQEWAQKGVSSEILEQAVAVARERKPKETIPVGYLRGIVDDLLNPPAAKPRGNGAGGDPRYHFGDVDRSGDAIAMAKSIERHGVTVPAGEIKF